MSKMGRKVMNKGAKAVEEDAKILKNYFKTRIAAQCASAGPPLGPLLGKYGLNIAEFCKRFNEQTKTLKKGIPLPVTVNLKPDRSFVINIHTPPVGYYLRQAAGIQLSKVSGETTVGKITFKHIYEIAKIKYEDPFEKYQVLEMDQIVRSFINTALHFGIEVVDEINPEEYQEFLNKRKEFLEEYTRKLQEEEKLKLQRA